MAELGFRHRDGRERWWSVSAVKLSEDRFMAFCADITDQRESAAALAAAKEDAEAANIAKSEFLANMSHELRTPLNGIMGMATLMETTTLSADQRRFVNIIAESGNNLQQIIADILDFAQIEANRLELNASEFDLWTSIEKRMEGLALQAQQKGLVCQLEIDASVPKRVKADEQRIRQLISNLVGNAIKFTDSGEIQVSVTQQSAPQEDAQQFPHICIRVRDTGIGIPKEKHNLMFQKFTQVDGSLTRKHGGTGLGLAICKEIAALMGGDIGFDSEPGKGSEFRVSFQVEALSEIADRGASPEEDSALPSFTGLVLLVEDDETNQQVGEMILETLGLGVTVAENGQAALQLLEKQNFDLVLMDCQMPLLTGYEATQAIRRTEAQQAGCPHIPIVAMTAHALHSDRDKCLAAGMDDYLSKPLDMADLIAVLQKWLPEQNRAEPAHPA